jgi:hypothetical protein
MRLLRAVTLLLVLAGCARRDNEPVRASSLLALGDSQYARGAFDSAGAYDPGTGRNHCPAAHSLKRFWQFQAKRPEAPGSITRRASPSSFSSCLIL